MSSPLRKLFGDWLFTSGAAHGRIVANEVAFPEQWNTQDAVALVVSGTAVATFVNTSPNSPLDSIVATKSGTTEGCALTLRLSPGRRGALIISGLTTETIALTGTITDSVGASVSTNNLMVRSSAAPANIVIGSGLGNGTYWLEF